MNIPRAPESYEGELSDLYEVYVEPLLPSVSSLKAFHSTLKDYCDLDDAVFYVRYRTDETRGERHVGHDGTPFVPTDNSPACWMHKLHSEGYQISSALVLAELLNDMPCHFFQVAKTECNHLYQNGWYIAHLLRAKPSRSRKTAESREVLKALFIRSIHPVNHFFLPDVPKGSARKIEGDSRVLAFVAERHSDRYGEIWDEFVEMAAFDAIGEIRAWGPPPPSVPIVQSRVRPNNPTLPTSRVQSSAPGEIAVVYSFSRFAFKANLIEPLEWNDQFQMETPEGTFIMSKRQFYDVFSNVVESKSYRIERIYHSAKAPKKALQFRAT